jgi:sugar phosphate permease
LKDRPAWFSAGLILFLTWLLFGMYYLTRFNFSAVIPLLKADLGISNAQAGGLMGEHLGWRSSFIIPPLMMAATALIFWILVRDHPREKGLPDFEDEVHLEQQIDRDARSRLMVVLSNRTLWSVALVYFFFVYVQFGCLVWIPSFLKETYAMSIDRASTVSFLILLPGVFASPLGGFLSDRIFGGRRKPLILLGLAVLSISSFLLSLRLSIALAAVILAVVGLMILMPDVLLAAYPSDILSRKLSATAMGFLATFTSASGIITTPVSGKIADLFQSYHAVFFSFGVVALVGMFMAFFINENRAREKA